MAVPSLEMLAFLEYRLKAVAIGHFAIRHVMSWHSPPPIRVYFGDRQVMEGIATAFTNGAIEAGVIHCRALLEFLGLKGNGPTRLSVRENSRKDDFVIEHAGLPKVSVEAAVKMYAGLDAEAEAALACVLHVANKGLAHATSAFRRGDGRADLLEIGFRGVPELLVGHFYKPLGLPAPNYELPYRQAI